MKHHRAVRQEDVLCLTPKPTNSGANPRVYFVKNLILQRSKTPTARYIQHAAWAASYHSACNVHLNCERRRITACGHDHYLTLIGNLAEGVSSARYVGLNHRNRPIQNLLEACEARGAPRGSDHRIPLLQG
jgi:hypothetical protein